MGGGGGRVNEAILLFLWLQCHHSLSCFRIKNDQSLALCLSLSVFDSLGH